MFALYFFILMCSGFLVFAFSNSSCKLEKQQQQTCDLFPLSILLCRHQFKVELLERDSFKPFKIYQIKHFQQLWHLIETCTIYIACPATCDSNNNDQDKFYAFQTDEREILMGISSNEIAQKYRWRQRTHRFTRTGIKKYLCVIIWKAMTASFRSPCVVQMWKSTLFQCLTL